MKAGADTIVKPAYVGLLVVALVAACGTEPAATTTAFPRNVEPARTVETDPRDQYALVDAIDEANRAAGSEPGIDAVAAGWKGRRFRWEMVPIPALCNGPPTCSVLPLDYAKLGHETAQGFLPVVTLDDAGYRRLVRICAGTTSCVVTFEARLAELVTSSDLPTRLTFDEVTVVRARAAAPTEQWLQAHAVPAGLLAQHDAPHAIRIMNPRGLRGR